MCTVSTSYHSLYKLDRLSQPIRWGCHCWKLQNQPFAARRRFGAACILWSRASINMHLIGLQLGAVKLKRKSTLKDRDIMSLQKPKCVLQVCDNTVQPVEKFKNCRGGIHEWRKAEKREWCTGSWGKRSIAWASVPWSQSASFAPNRKIPATLVRSRDRNTPRKVGEGSPFRSPVRGSKETKGRNYISDLAWRRLGMVAAK